MSSTNISSNCAEPVISKSCVTVTSPVIVELPVCVYTPTCVTVPVIFVSFNVVPMSTVKFSSIKTSLFGTRTLPLLFACNIRSAFNVVVKILLVSKLKASTFNCPVIS